MANETSYDSADVVFAGGSAPRGGGGEPFVAQLITLSNLLRRVAMLRLPHVYGLTLVEWQIITGLGARGGRSLTDVADSIGLTREQISGKVAALVARGFVERGHDPGNIHRARLALTPRGAALHSLLMRRNAELIADIAREELTTVQDVLARLSLKAERWLLEEQKTPRVARGRFLRVTASDWANAHAGGASPDDPLDGS